MTYEDVMAYVHNTGRSYWIGRFYKNYNGLLDAYITFAHTQRYYHFVMDFDPRHVHIGEDYEGYPTPAHFYLTRNAIVTRTSWTLAEYNAVPDPPAAIPTAPVAIPATDPPAAITTATVAIPATAIEEYGAEAIPAATIEGDGTEATIEEGGTEAI